MISLLAIYLSTAITFGANGVTLDRVTLDPWILIRARCCVTLPWNTYGRTGLVLPGVVYVAAPGPNCAECVSNMDGVLAHELGHVHQIQALGAPTQFGVYLLTSGSAFEDYQNPGAWQPPAPAGAVVSCPMFTWRPGVGLALWECHPRP